MWCCLTKLFILERIKQLIATVNGKFLLKRNTINLNCRPTINYLMQVMYHLCSKNTIPPKQ